MKIEGALTSLNREPSYFDSGKFSTFGVKTCQKRNENETMEKTKAEILTSSTAPCQILCNKQR